MIKRIARFKIYVERARWYMVFIQFIMIIILFLQNNSIKIDLWMYPIITLVILFIMIVIGFIDRRLGIIKEEQRFYSTENPVIQEILKRIKIFEIEDYDCKNPKSKSRLY